MNKRLIITGANGFVGKSLLQQTSVAGFTVTGLTRAGFDITNAGTYGQYGFCGATIVDCIASIDGDKAQRVFVNYTSLQEFIRFLNRECGDNYRYVYFSTLSTLEEDLVTGNDYVATKYKAEAFIREQVANYKIIRLSYPFGTGESANRLFSRLTQKIRQGEMLELANASMYVTPVALLTSSFADMLKSPEKEINFTCGKPVTLEEIVTTLGAALQCTPRYKIKEEAHRMPPETPGFHTELDMLNAIKEFADDQR